MEPHSLYLHIPFCTHKCSYCDFNTYAGLEGLISSYAGSLCREIELFSIAAGQRYPLHTVFFGGGTPSLLSLGEIERIITSLASAFSLKSPSEITIEANPGTLSPDYLRGLVSIGVNRLSLGMQSSRPEELLLLERQHDFSDVVKAVTWSRQAGFRNLNLDLIFGLPYQSLQSWKRSLELALALRPDHLSLYALTLEQGTPLHSWVDRGLVAAPDPDLAAEMYEWSSEQLELSGFRQYEISNWARKAEPGVDYSSRHNLQYWRNLPYIGLGAGAHGFVGGKRTANVLGPAAYIRRFQDEQPREFPRTPATVEVIPIDRITEMRETLLMGLRLTQQGVTSLEFEARFGVPLLEAFPVELGRLLDRKLIEWSGVARESIRLTPQGRLLGNHVFVEFV